GATSWHEFTEYHPDPGEALRRLTQEVFAAGRYQCPAVAPLDRIRRLYEEAGAGADSPECREALGRHEAMRRALETGSEEDLRRLSRADRAVVRRARVFPEIAGGFRSGARRLGRPPAGGVRVRGVFRRLGGAIGAVRQTVAGGRTPHRQTTP